MGNNLSQEQPVGDRLTHHEGADQVLDSSSLTAVGSEVERVQTSVEGELFKQSRHQWAIRIYRASQKKLSFRICPKLTKLPRFAQI